MRYSLLLTAFVALLCGAGPAFAGPGSTTGGTTPPDTTPAPVTVAVDPVLAKLNALEHQLEAMTAKLDAATIKLNALSTKTLDIWAKTHYTQGLLEIGFPKVFEMVDRTCNVADNARDYAADAAYGNVVHAYVGKCP